MKNIFTKENLPLLIAGGLVLLSLIVGTVMIVLAANGVFRPSPEDSSSTTGEGGTDEWEDPDNKNWTVPVA